MADKILCDKTDLVNIANAVRNKNGTSNTYYVSELGTAVQNIQTAPSLQAKEVNITSNGTTNVAADEGYDGLSSVDVTVNVSGLGAIDWMDTTYGLGSPSFNLSNCEMKNLSFRDLDSSFNLKGNVIFENVNFYGGSVTISNLDLDNVELRFVIFNGCSVTCSQTFYDAFLAGNNYSVDTNFDIV